MTKKKKKVAKKAPTKKKTAKKVTKARRAGRPPLPSNVLLCVKGQVRMTAVDWAAFQKSAKEDGYDGFSPWALAILREYADGAQAPADA